MTRLSRRETAAFLVAGILGLVLLLALSQVFLAVAGQGRVLARSLTRVAHVPFEGDCSQHADRWSCSISDPSGSGYATYSVKKMGHCWHAVATITSRRTFMSMPVRVGGCVRYQDRYPLLTVLGTVFDPGLTDSGEALRPIARALFRPSRADRAFGISWDRPAPNDRCTFSAESVASRPG
jgi:hypothetical protein